MAQFGLHGAPEVNNVWRQVQIPDDPVTQSNTRGMVTLPLRDPTPEPQLFINLVDNTSLDNQGFAPFAKVIDSRDSVAVWMWLMPYLLATERVLLEDEANQQLIHQRGNAYLKAGFSRADYIVLPVRGEGPTPEGAPEYCYHPWGHLLCGMAGKSWPQRPLPICMVLNIPSKHLALRIV